MTELLDRVVARIRDLPDDDQDAFASVLMAALATATDVVPLDEASRAAIQVGTAQADRGDYAPDADIAALWRRHGL